MFPPRTPKQAALGMRHDLHAPKIFGAPLATPNPAPTVANCRVVIMTHPKRAPMAAALAAQWSAYAPVVVCDVPGGGIMQNARRVLETMLAAPADPEHWSIVIEDDAICPGLAEALPALLQSLPEGVAGWSLHSELQAPGRGAFRGWRYRVRTEILRTQFAAYRRSLVPALIAGLDNYERTTRLKVGWDTSCTRVLDALGLQSVIYYPNPVQHESGRSLLAHHTKVSPSYQPARGANV